MCEPFKKGNKVVPDFETSVVANRVKLYNVTMSLLSKTVAETEFEIIDTMMWKGLFASLRHDYSLTDKEINRIIVENQLDTVYDSLFKEGIINV